MYLLELQSHALLLCMDFCTEHNGPYITSLYYVSPVNPRAINKGNPFTAIKGDGSVVKRKRELRELYINHSGGLNF